MFTNNPKAIYSDQKYTNPKMYSMDHTEWLLPLFELTYLANVWASYVLYDLRRD